MGTRRGNGEGSFVQRSDGRIEALLRYTDIRGKAHRVSAYGATRKQAKAALDEKMRRIREGLAVVDSKSPLADVARKWRTTTLVASKRATNTRNSYAIRCQHYIEKGMLADIPLARLTPSDVETWIVAAQANEKISDSSLRTDYTILRSILDSAVRDGLVARNVAEQVDRPRRVRKEAVCLPPAQVVALLKAVRPSRHWMPIYLMAATGMRRGEVLGLRWKDIDLTAGTIAITGTLTGSGQNIKRIPTPKTKASFRTLPLGPELTQMLKDRLAEQVEHRRKAANLWEGDEHDLVFTTEVGKPLDGRNVLRTLQTAAQNLDLPKSTSLHTLRHSAATMMLESGVHLKLVSAILGHSDTAITADIYGHAPDAAQRVALDALQAQITSPRHLYALPDSKDDVADEADIAGEFNTSRATSGSYLANSHGTRT